MELQLLYSFAYFNQNYTDLALKMLRASRKWVYFNFFDSFCDDVIQSEPKDFIFTEWSSSAFKNIFTICLFILFYLIFYFFLKIWAKKSELLKFFQFEAGLHLIKIFTFRVSLAMFIEVYRLADGEESSYNTGLVAFVALMVLMVAPIGKIFYLRLKFLGNLDSNKVLTLFGSDYRDYRTCWREFHIIPEKLCLVISAASIAFLEQFETVQIFLVLGCLVLFTGYSIIFKPFRELKNNLHYCMSRTFITSIFCVVVGRHYYEEDMFLDFSLLILMFLYYSLKLLFVFYEISLALGNVKKILESAEDDFSLIQKKNQKLDFDPITNNDKTIISSNRLNEENDDLQKESTSTKKRIKKVGTAESSDDSLDPRLTRKRASRKKK
jgi:hypothetical protein